MDKRAMLDYVAFLSASADNLKLEPASYGQLRLIDAVARIIDLMRNQDILQDDELDSIAKDIHENMFSLMTDPEGFDTLLKRTNISLAGIVAKN